MPILSYYPPAKINVFLEVLGKRSDGYHSIHSLFLPVSLCDVLTFESCDTDQITLDTSIDCAIEDNLVWKAAKMLQEEYSITSGAKIRLQKNIPTGAGLGGGSSDAAFTLKGLNELWGIGSSNDELRRIAACLGSDCPFFIDAVPSIVTGRGEYMEMLPMQLDKVIVLVHPGIHISTAKAYSWFGYSSEVSLKEKQCDAAKPESYKNDFEAPVFTMHPTLAAIKSDLYDAGASYAAMTGSGSTIFGFFDNIDLAELCIKSLNYHCHIVRQYPNHISETLLS